MRIVGIQIRTSNKRAMFDLLAHWKKFEKIKQEIPGEGIYVVYSDYESDFRGEYNYLIGKRVGNVGDIKGFTEVRIEEGKYEKFPVEGAMPFALIKKWQEIWTKELPRAYKTDYEIYHNHQSVDIYIGVKE